MATTRVRSALAAALWASAAALLVAPAPTLAQSQEPGPATPPAAPTAAPAPRRATLAATHDEKPTATAVRTDASFNVDGQLDEPAWMTAPPVTEFWQVDPDEGAPVSERTEVRFLYDDENLYVGAWLYDTDDQMVTRLSRRDTGIPDVDLFAVHFDSYHSHRSSNRFTISALGTIRDMAAPANTPLTGGDQSWNPVYDYRTTITEEGWFVELRIPFSQLRFSQADEQVWGLQMERKIRPQQENTIWAFSRKTDPVGQLNFGHLVGIKGVRPGRKLELLPYAGGSAEYVSVPQSPDATFANPFRSGRDYFGNAGLDLKYRLTTNLTLDGTVNPDFGQVEVDPAVINLTAFETRFQERRPFFVEGAEIYQFGEDVAQIFYSRRIGRPPHGSAPSTAVYNLTPTATTILGAGKLSGKTASGWSLAFLDAVAARETADWRDGLNRESEIEVEPLTNYFAGRARRDMRAGQTTLGALVTAVNRNLSDSPLEPNVHASAYSAGIDFSHDWANRAWHMSASFSPSYVTGSTGALIATQRTSTRYYQRPDADYLEVDSGTTSLFGYSAQAGIEKQNGRWRMELAGSAISPGYEVNDLGFQTLADRLAVRGGLAYEQTRPGPVFRNWSLRTNSDLAWNYGRDLIGSSTTFQGQVQLPNFATVVGRFTVNPSKLNQRLTRGGPLSRDPVGYATSLNYNTVNQARVSMRSGAEYGWDDSGAWQRSVNVGANIRVGEKFEAQIGPNFTQSRSTAQYVSSVADPTATGTFGRRYLFADLEQSTLSIDARFNITLSPRVTMEIFAQPLLGSGDYLNVKELRAPSTFEFNVFGRDAGTMTPIEGERRYEIDPDGAGPARTFRIDNRDFNTRSLRANAVFRWEWRPGSTLFVVWQQNRSGSLAASDPDNPYTRVGNFRLGRDLGDLFEADSDNILMIKASYWLNP